MKDHLIEWTLIARKLKGKLTAEEEEEFTRWLEEEEAHREYFKKAEALWAEEPGDYPPPDLEKLMLRFDAFADQVRPVVHRTLSPGLWRYAAAVVVLLGIAVGMLWYQTTGEGKPGGKVSVAREQIVPGTARASIILADGRQLDLEGRGKQTVTEEERGASIRMQKGMVAYEAKGKETEEVYNTMVIPRGGEYCLKLSDGTKVWLNARTRLRFPVNFTGSQRRVELEGEAYFEVARDTEHPFIVHTACAEMRVYGTSFNVRAYPDENMQHTTLAEGQVGVIREGQEYRLQPGEQARINRKKRDVTVEKVNVILYCGWHKGLLLFENQRLEEIMGRLADWYDVEVVFTEEYLKDLHFTGDLERYADFTDILRLIGMTTHVRFEVQERKVAVYAAGK